MSKPFLLASFFIISCAHSFNTTHSLICPPSSCGNEVSIRYPFWLSDANDEYCGYPDFGLRCSDEGQTILTLPSDSYYVKDINYDEYTITLVDMDVVNQTCPRARYNVTIGTLPLSYSPLDLNLSFYFNCSSFPSASAVAPIECFKNSEIVKESYVFVEGNESGGFEGSVNCEKVVVTVKEDQVDRAQLISRFGKAMNEGFVLTWGKARNCSLCEDSVGYCGYNRTSGESLCFCRDGSVAHGNNSCKKAEHPPNWKRKIIIGVVCAGVGALSVSVAFYFYLRRKKNRYTASFVQSRSLSSDPSLKDPEKGSKYFGAHVFTYSELEEATNNFDSNKELGDGGFGTVYFGKLRDGRQVAVKRLYENNYRRLEQFMNEVEILTRLRHHNLVSLYGCTSRHSRELLLVYEYIPNGTVADHLHGGRAKPGTMTWDIRMNIAVETASALAYLHASDIIHRDVKTNNILLDNHFVVKVADFGLSRLFPNDVTHISTAPQGTPGYVDPEYHECYQLTDKSDVYSFGVVLIELISSMPAVDITRHRHEINLSNMAINKIQNRALHELVDPSLGFESDYKVRKMINAVAELAFQCLQNMKDLRPFMEEVAERLKDIQNDGKSNTKAEEIDIPAADDVVLLKNEPPPASPDSNMRSTSTTPNASG